VLRAEATLPCRQCGWRGPGHGIFCFALARAPTMGKSRFTTTDVAAEAACLRAHLLGMRCTNIYDAPDGKASVFFLFFTKKRKKVGQTARPPHPPPHTHPT
jgi:hypothetical protein